MFHFIKWYFPVYFSGCLRVAGQKHDLNILDNAGQHDYESTRTCSYKDSEVLVLCYSVVDRESLASIKDFWVPEVSTQTSRRKPIILVATQTDLRKVHNIGHISTEEGEALAKEIGAEAFLECSAYDKDTVNHVFVEITTSGLHYRKRKNNFVSRFFGK